MLLAEPFDRCRMANRDVCTCKNDVLSEFYVNGEEEQAEETTAKRYVCQPPAKHRFSGHRNARTMMKEASWWGNNFVLSGSDCGHLFGWDVESGKLVLLLEADRHVVNCVQPHPFEPLIATSGIDYNVKLWSPIGPKVTFNQEEADEVSGSFLVLLVVYISKNGCNVMIVFGSFYT